MVIGISKKKKGNWGLHRDMKADGTKNRLQRHGRSVVQYCWIVVNGKHASTKNSSTNRKQISVLLSKHERTAQIKGQAMAKPIGDRHRGCTCTPRLVPLLRDVSCCLGRRRAHAAAAGVRRPAGQRRGEQEAAEHAADDPLQHRPSPGDVARVHSLRRRVLVAVTAGAPTPGTHGGGWVGDWLAPSGDWVGSARTLGK